MDNSRTGKHGIAAAMRILRKIYSNGCIAAEDRDNLKHAMELINSEIDGDANPAAWISPYALQAIQKSAGDVTALCAFDYRLSAKKNDSQNVPLYTHSRGDDEKL